MQIAPVPPQSKPVQFSFAAYNYCYGFNIGEDLYVLLHFF